MPSPQPARAISGFHILVALVLVMNAVGLFLTFDNIRVSSKAEAARTPQSQEPNLATVRTFEHPLAILVLDVSGSMIENDPNGQQGETVKNFLRLYQTMVYDALKTGDQARVGVVLFATAAQVLEWPDAQGRREPFLVLPQSRNELDQAIDNALSEFIVKKGASDPRQGWQTDYFEACNAVQGLLKQAGNVGPPCVIFMTDGEDNPFLPFAPSASSERQRMLGELASSITNVAHEFYRDQPNALSQIEKVAGELAKGGVAPPAGVHAGQRLWDPARDCRQGLGAELSPCITKALSRVTLAQSVAAARTSKLQGLLAEMARQDFALSGSSERLPMIWEFIYLGSKSDDVDALGALARPLARTEDRWHLPYKGVLHCRLADQLQGSFMEILSQWLNLEGRPLAAGTGSFVIEPKTTGLGLALQTDSKVTAVQMVGPNNERVEMTRCASTQGKTSWFSAVNRPSSGLWHIEPAGDIADGTVWARQRYRWYFGGVPSQLSPLCRYATVSLQVYDMVSGLPVPPTSLYQAASLPAAVDVQVSRSGNPTVALTLKADRDASGSIVSYTNSLPELPQTGAGKLVLQARLSGLVFSGTAAPIPPQPATTEVNLASYVDFQLQSEDGQPTAALNFQRLVPGMTSGGSR